MLALIAILEFEMSDKSEVEKSDDVVSSGGTGVAEQPASGTDFAPAVVDSQSAASAPRRFMSKGGALVALGVLLLLIGVGSWGLWFTRQTEKPQETTKTVAPKLQQKIDASEKLRASRDYDGAKAVWQQSLAGNPTEEERYKAYRQIGALDETKGDLAAALVSYHEAEKLTDTKWRPEYEAMARCYEKLGDKPNALKYYQLSLDMYPDSEQYVGDRKYYTKKIERLKQTVGTQQNG